MAHDPVGPAKYTNCLTTLLTVPLALLAGLFLRRRRDK